jgi:hypothetical protein
MYTEAACPAFIESWWAQAGHISKEDGYVKLNGAAFLFLETGYQWGVAG